MENSNNNYINHIKNMYRKAKHVLEVASDADSPEAMELRQVATIEGLEQMHDFVTDLENHGIDLLFIKN